MQALKMLSLGAFVLTLTSCSNSEYSPTVSDKDSYIEAVAKTMGYEGDDALDRLKPSLAAQVIESGLDTCETMRGDHDEAVIAFGLARAMYEDQSLPISAEDEWRLAIRHLCPDVQDEFDTVFDDAW